jgi:hypothetical protein
VRKPTKRVLLGVGSMLVVVAVVTSLSTGPKVWTWDGYAAVNVGMTEAEVVSVLGPPGASNAGPTDYCVSMTADQRAAFERLDTRNWITDDALIWVGFGPDGRAAKKFCTANRYGPPSWFGVALHRLGW